VRGRGWGDWEEGGSPSKRERRREGTRREVDWS